MKGMTRPTTPLHIASSNQASARETPAERSGPTAEKTGWFSRKRESFDPFEIDDLFALIQEKIYHLHFFARDLLQNLLWELGYDE